MKTDFTKTYNRRGTKCFKWDKNKELFCREDIISMWVADMDLPTAPAVMESIKKRAEHPLLGYTFRDELYYQAYINWQKERNHWEIKREWILNSTSVVISLNLIIRTLTPPAANILIMPPVYSQFSQTLKDTGRNMVTSPLINNNGLFVPDFNDLELKLSAGVDLLILCSPHNPVGRVWDKEELKKIAKLCLNYNTLIISDEIHSDLVYDESTHLPLASLSEEISANTITCTSPGKTFNISGLSIGFIICENPDLREKIFSTFMNLHLLAANIFAIEACQAAYTNGKEWLQNLLEHLKGNRDFLTRFINEEIPQVKINTIQGTYLAWLDFRSLNLKQTELVAFLVFIAGLGLDNGTKYGSEGEGFMRLNFACSRSLLKEALQKLKDALHRFNNDNEEVRKIINNSEAINDCD